MFKLHYITDDILGDDDAVNNLRAEDLISTGNKYIYTPYHWIKEVDEGKFTKVFRKGTKDDLNDLFAKPCVREVCDCLVDKLEGYAGC